MSEHHSKTRKRTTTTSSKFKFELNAKRGKKTVIRNAQFFLGKQNYGKNDDDDDDGGGSDENEAKRRRRKRKLFHRFLLFAVSLRVRRSSKTVYWAINFNALNVSFFAFFFSWCAFAKWNCSKETPVSIFVSFFCCSFDNESQWARMRALPILRVSSQT